MLEAVMFIGLMGLVVAVFGGTFMAIEHKQNQKRGVLAMA